MALSHQEAVFGGTTFWLAPSTGAAFAKQNDSSKRSHQETEV